MLSGLVSSIRHFAPPTLDSVHRTMMEIKSMEINPIFDEAPKADSVVAIDKKVVIESQALLLRGNNPEFWRACFS
jgi:hypothetical protein